MAESTPTSTNVQIPYSQIEYTLFFDSPVLKAFVEPSSLIESVLTALKPHGFQFDGVESIRGTKTGEWKTTFRRANSPLFIYGVAPNRLWVTADNLDWSGAEEAIGCIETALAAFKRTLNYVVTSQVFVLSMHVQMKDKTPAEISESLVTPNVLKILDGAFKCHGLVLTRDKATFVLDNSASFANALFMRIAREYAADTTLGQIANRLRADEENIFKVLGLEGDL